MYPDQHHHQIHMKEKEVWEGKGIKSPEMERITDKEEGHMLLNLLWESTCTHTHTHTSYHSSDLCHKLKLTSIRCYFNLSKQALAVSYSVGYICGIPIRNSWWSSSFGTYPITTDRKKGSLTKYFTQKWPILLFLTFLWPEKAVEPVSGFKRINYILHKVYRNAEDFLGIETILSWYYSARYVNYTRIKL